MLTGTTNTAPRDTECGLFNNNINHAITEAWIDEGSPHLTIIKTQGNRIYTGVLEVLGRLYRIYHNQ